MKSAPFDYIRAENLEQALSVLSRTRSDARIIAGGQSLVPMMAMRLARPEVLVDINHVEGLRGIETGDGVTVIHAGTRQVMAERSGLVGRDIPLLAAALPHVGHIQTRNRGTIGGSLAHADPTAEILLTAIALEAQLTLTSSRGVRRLTAVDFVMGSMETAAEDDELLTEVWFAAPPKALSIGVSVDEISPRVGDYALVGVAAEIGLDADRVCRHLRLAASGAAPVPVRAAAVEAALLGSTLAAREIDEAVRLIDPLLDPHSDAQASAAYRRRVTPGLLARAIGAARDRAWALAA